MLSNIQSEFIANGFVNISNQLDFNKEFCKNLLKGITDSRLLDESFFIDEPSDLSIIYHNGVNPKANTHNLLLDLDTTFIEENKRFHEILESILGNYNVILKKIICGLPDSSIPSWVIDLVRDKPVPNLGGYIKPQYRDITYFRGIDWHQDIIDFPGQNSRFITLYIYLHDVGLYDAPLWVIPKSHILGATQFPHNLSQLSPELTLGNDWGVQYMDTSKKNTLYLNKLPLTGSTGSAYFWHSSILHGTTQVYSSSPRVSLRYLIAQKEGYTKLHTNSYPINVVEQLTLNTTSIDVVRSDIDKHGNFVKSGNIIKGI